MRTTLGEICTQDRTIAPQDGDDLPYLGLEQIESQTGRILSVKPPSAGQAGVGTTFRFDVQHVLYSKLRPYLNKVAVPTNVGRCSTELIPLRPVPGVDREFLAFALRSPDAVAHASSANTGARMPRADLKHLFSWPLQVPDLPTQRRLAARLKQQMAAVEVARQRVRCQLASTRLLSTKLLAEVIDERRDGSWQMMLLSDVIQAPLRTGISKRGSPQSQHHCLGLSAVRNGRLDLSATKPIDLTAVEAQRNRLTPGALYVVRGNGNIALVGRGAVSPVEPADHIVFPDLLIEVNPSPSVIDVAFLRWAWDAPSVRQEIEARSMTTSGIYKINLGNLGQISVPVPPLETQRRIAARLREQFDHLDQLQTALTTQLEALNKLPGAFLREAFGSLETVTS